MKQSATISSNLESVPVICPICTRSTIGAVGDTCECGWQIPKAFVIPYEAKWDYEPDLLSLLQEHAALRLMGRNKGHCPERLAELRHATYLYLSRYPNFSFDYLTGFDRLRILELDLTSFKTLSGIQKIENLQSLSLVECKELESADGLESCTDLRVLKVAICNRLVDLSPAGSCQQLLYFKYEGRQLQSIQFMRGLRQLQTVVLNSRLIDRDISPIVSLDLKKLFARKNTFAKQDFDKFRSENPQCDLDFI